MIGKCKGVLGKVDDTAGRSLKWNIQTIFFPVGDPDKFYDLEQVIFP